MGRVVGFFRAVYRAQRTEALVLLLWEDGQFAVHVPRQRVSGSSVKFTLAEDELPAGSRLVGTIHSHGAFGAFASSIDEADEAELDGLHLVVGDLDRRRPSYSAAIAVDGHRFEAGLQARPRAAARLRRATGRLAGAGEAPSPAPAQEAVERLDAGHVGLAPGPRVQSDPTQPERVRQPSSRRPAAWRTNSAIASATGSPRCPHRASREGRAMPSRIVLIGCGGIGSQLAGPLVRYLASRPEPTAPRPRRRRRLRGGEPVIGRPARSATWARTRPRPWPGSLDRPDWRCRSSRST